MRGPAVAIDAGFEAEKTVDGTKLQATVGDQDEIADRVDDEPGGQDFATPEMQEDRDQRDLLGDPQHHLEQTGGPTRKQPARPARDRNAPEDLIFAARVDQGPDLIGTPRGLSVRRKDVDS